MPKTFYKNIDKMLMPVFPCFFLIYRGFWVFFFPVRGGQKHYNSFAKKSCRKVFAKKIWNKSQTVFPQFFRASRFWAFLGEGRGEGEGEGSSKTPLKKYKSIWPCHFFGGSLVAGL
jgi:hypothetical protein